MRKLFLFGIALSLSACMMAGKQDLIEKSLKDQLIITGKTDLLTDCIIDQFETEPRTISWVQAYVTRVHKRADGSVEILGGINDVYYWMTVLTPQNDNQVLVDITARKLPNRSDTHMLRRVRRNVQNCAAG